MDYNFEPEPTFETTQSKGPTDWFDSLTDIFEIWCISILFVWFKLTNVCLLFEIQFIASKRVQKCQIEWEWNKHNTLGFRRNKVSERTNSFSPLEDYGPAKNRIKNESPNGIHFYRIYSQKKELHGKLNKIWGWMERPNKPRAKP